MIDWILNAPLRFYNDNLAFFMPMVFSDWGVVFPSEIVISSKYYSGTIGEKATLNFSSRFRSVPAILLVSLF